MCEILSRSNMTVKIYGPDTDFGYMCTVTLTLEIWPWIKNLIQYWAIDNIIHMTISNMAVRRQILDMCALWPWLWRYDLGLKTWHTLGSWTKIGWNIILISQGGKKLWSCMKDLNRQTLRGFLYPPPPHILFALNTLQQCRYNIKNAGYIKSQKVSKNESDTSLSPSRVGLHQANYIMCST